MKNSLYSFALKIILLLPITIIIQDLFPAINRIMMGIVMVLLASLLVMRLKKKVATIPLVLFVVVYAWALFVGGFAQYINENFYFPLFVLFYLTIMNSPEEFKEFCDLNSKYILNIIRLWSVVVFISMLFPSSYENGVFISFTNTSFRTATSACFIFGLLFLVAKHKRVHILYSILPMFIFFAGGSRTYFAIGTVMFLLLWYLWLKHKNNFWLTLIPFAILFAVILVNSSIFEKIMDSLTIDPDEYVKDPLEQFTSGRSVFWKKELEVFFDTGVLRQFLGNGMNFVKQITLENYGNDIWSHNDFIEVLLSFGYLGCGLYVFIFHKTLSVFFKGKKLPKLIIFGVWFVWFFNAFFNMFYTYICASFAIPFLAYGVEQLNSKWQDQKRSAKGNVTS